MAGGSAGATVRLRWLSLKSRIGGSPPAWCDGLDEAEVARADRFVHAIDRESSVAAHALKRAMLAAATGLSPAALRFGGEFRASRIFSAPMARRGGDTTSHIRVDLSPVSFFRYWTLKEAFIKATGEGLHRLLDSFVARTDPPRIIASSGTDALPPAQLFQWCPQAHRFVALAVLCPSTQSLSMDAQAAPHGGPTGGLTAPCP